MMGETMSALVLGLLQGLTEFLPVSSSGHLVLARVILPRFAAPPAAFEALLHSGTLLAVLLFFRRDLAAMLSGMFGPVPPGSTRAMGTPFASQAGSPGHTKDQETTEAEAKGVPKRLPLLILLGSLPAGVIGVVFKDRLERLFSAPVVAGAGLLVTAIFLLAAGRWAKGERPLAALGRTDVLVIGCFQALAIVPGVSRSGSTIAAALLLGLAGTAAARFSFLLSIPAVAGAVLMEAPRIAGAPGLPAFLLGTAAASASGYMAIAWMMRLLRERLLWPFALYCAALGSLSLLILL
jgi:undecaprenyl-diphosphatase